MDTWTYDKYVYNVNEESAVLDRQFIARESTPDFHRQYKQSNIRSWVTTKSAEQSDPSEMRHDLRIHNKFNNSTT
jgi:hypothetical protein